MEKTVESLHNLNINIDKLPKFQFFDEAMENLDLDELFIRAKCEFLLHKMIFAKDLIGVQKLIERFKNDDERLKCLINLQDFRENTPLLLAVIIRLHAPCKTILQIVQELLSHEPHHIRNSRQKSPFELAQSHEDQDLLSLIYENFLAQKKQKIEKNKEKAKTFLSQCPNFHLEMKWEVNVPLLSYFCPNDTCKIWKFYENVRMDYSFVEFKNMSSVKSPSSWFFLGNSPSLDVNLADWEKRTFFSPFEDLDEEERKLVLEEIMNHNRINGEFKIKNCQITESLSSWTKKPVYEKINGWNAKKYEVNITAFVNLHSKEKIVYENLTFDNYFDDEKDLGMKLIFQEDKENVKKNIMDNMKVSDEKMRKALMKIEEKGDKKLKAYVWVAENFPIKSSSLTAVIDSVSDANEFTKKIKEFLKDKEVKKILENNGFPIKISIPVNFLIDVTVKFTKFLEIQSPEEVKDLFKIPSDMVKITRKSAQNLAENPSKRLALANVPIY